MTNLPAFRSLTPIKPPTKPATDPRADAVAMILKGGRFRRGLQEDKPGESDDQEKRDNKPGKPDEPAPGDLILDAIRRRQEGK